MPVLPCPEGGSLSGVHCSEFKYYLALVQVTLNSLVSKTVENRFVLNKILSSFFFFFLSKKFHLGKIID